MELLLKILLIIILSIFSIGTFILAQYKLNDEIWGEIINKEKDK